MASVGHDEGGKCGDQGGEDDGAEHEDEHREEFSGEKTARRGWRTRS